MTQNFFKIIFGSGKTELVRWLLTLAAAVYLIFAVTRAIVLSPDLLSTFKEFFTTPAGETKLKVIHNLSYVTPADLQRSGDLYLPQFNGERRPAVILIHGGTWKEGSRAMETESARYIVEHGYVAFNIDYRLVGHGGEFPHDIADVKDAMAFLTDHASEYNVDRDKIVLFGSSSGGHMAMLAAYSPNITRLQAEVHKESTARAAAVVSLYGLSDLKGEFVRDKIKDHLVNYLDGKTAREAPGLYAEASPINYARTAVPTIFAHGTDDHNVLMSQSTMMAAALKKNGLRYEVVPVEGASHWFGPVTRDLVLSRVVAFLNGVLNYRKAGS
jgi:acetyl esterase/lipase